MKMLEDPLNAMFVVKQFCDWKFHARSLPLRRTSFTYEPNELVKGRLSTTSIPFRSNLEFQFSWFAPRGSWHASSSLQRVDRCDRWPYAANAIGADGLIILKFHHERNQPWKLKILPPQKRLSLAKPAPPGKRLKPILNPLWRGCGAGTRAGALAGKLTRHTWPNRRRHKRSLLEKPGIPNWNSGEAVKYQPLITSGLRISNFYNSPCAIRRQNREHEETPFRIVGRCCQAGPDP